MSSLRGESERWDHSEGREGDLFFRVQTYTPPTGGSSILTTKLMKKSKDWGKYKTGQLRNDRRTEMVRKFFYKGKRGRKKSKKKRPPS